MSIKPYNASSIMLVVTKWSRFIGNKSNSILYLYIDSFYRKEPLAIDTELSLSHMK